jgi:hypothetical protein
VFCAQGKRRIAGSARLGPDRKAVIIGRLAIAIESAIPDALRLCTTVGFCRYVEEEGVIEHSPAVKSAGTASTTSPPSPT